MSTYATEPPAERAERQGDVRVRDVHLALPRVRPT
jgi:hypothetical protein